MADNQEELRQLFETGISDRQIQQAKDKNKADFEALMKQGAALGTQQQKKETPMESLGKSVPKSYKKGGKTMEHKHHDDHVKQHEAGGHKHHSEHYGKHAAGHKKHADHVKSMCGGGKARK